MKPIFRTLALGAMIVASIATGPARADTDGDQSPAPITRTPLCTPLLITAGVAEASIALINVGPPPEVHNAGRIAASLGLDERIARIGHVRAPSRVRGPHKTIVLEDAVGARLSSFDSLRAADWFYLRRLVFGLSRADRARLLSVQTGEIDLADLRVLTVRTRLPDRTRDVPLASLSLGRRHYELELRVPVGQTETVPAYPRARQLGTKPWRRGSRPTSELADALPGGVGHRGVLTAQLIGEVAPDGTVEALFSKHPAVLRMLRGTWFYDHEWLTLRILILDRHKILLR